MKIRLVMAAFLLSLFSCNEKRELSTVSSLDIERYLGTWYEIARLPNSFEKDLICVTAQYSMRDDGKIDVLNSGFDTSKNIRKKANGYAKLADETKPGELKVTFFWPFFGDYFVLDLGKDYEYALVGDPSRKYLWILSRETVLDPEIYSDLIAKAKSLGFKTDDLYKVDQSCW